MFISFLFLSSPSLAEIPKDALIFHYQPHEGTGARCTHQQIRNLPDWNVLCKNRFGTREFSVHLVVKKHSRKAPNETGYEVLYWVTNRLSPRKREYTGTSMTFVLHNHVKEKVIRIGQQVDKGTAHLDLTIRP